MSVVRPSPFLRVSLGGRHHAKVKANTGVDWQHSENARARIRVMVKRILRKHGYPPDIQDAAVQLVLEQGEALSAMWAA